MLLEEHSDDGGAEFSMDDMLAAIQARVRLITAVTCIFGLVAAAIAFSLPKYYMASTVFLSPQSPQNAGGSALAQLGMLAGAVGGNVKSQDELYVALLRTRAVQDQIVKEFELMQRYDLRNLSAAREKLISLTRVGADKKTGIINIDVEDTDPSMAEAIANAYFSELSELLKNIALTDAKQRRLFYEMQVNKSKAALAAAEARFQRERKSSGFRSGQVIAESSMKASIELRAQLTAKEIQLASMGAYATAQNEDLKRVQLEISALKNQLSAAETGTQGAGDGDASVPSSVPAYRDLRVQEAVLLELNKQLELSRLTEASEGPLLQQIDKAVATDYPVRPRRVLMTVGGGMIGLLLALGWVLGAKWRQLVTQPGGRLAGHSAPATPG
jgi:tyrosine-protein kinase Etk/Wzc